jgi:hypothetical protein
MADTPSTPAENTDIFTNRFPMPLGSLPEDLARASMIDSGLVKRTRHGAGQTDWAACQSTYQARHG